MSTTSDRSLPLAIRILAVWILASGISASYGTPGAWTTNAKADTTKPNIVFILADDMGYGEVQCMNPERCKVPTPLIDRLASEGMLFTDAHSSSSVCTPTRYSVLTGRYNWRTSLQRFVLYGYSPPLIPSDRMTVPSLLQQHGYQTAAFGKWHLGMTLPTTDGKAPQKGHHPKNIDWSGTITNGPNSVGFDYYFGISASLDMPPYIFIENDRFLGEASTTKKYMREGPAEPDFDAVNVLPEIKKRTVHFIENQDSITPYFAYVALNSPHTPILPSEAWQGKSDVGAYGDFVMQTDDLVGAVVDAIDRTGGSENTLVIFTTDNGCSPMAGIEKLQKRGHYVSGPLRGAKGDLWEGGHRVPMVAKWPKVIEAGTSCSETIGQWDLMASCADLLSVELPEQAGEDSVSFLPAFHSKPIAKQRKGVVHHAIDGHFAYRSGKWKLLLARGSGGLTRPREKSIPETEIEAQLYDLESDLGETKNLYTQHPEVAKMLLEQLTEIRDSGRSTKGPPSENDVQKIKLWKNR